MRVNHILTVIGKQTEQIVPREVLNQSVVVLVSESFLVKDDLLLCIKDRQEFFGVLLGDSSDGQMK